MADIKVESAVMQLATQHGSPENDDLEVVVERANNIELKLSTTELAGCAGSMQGVSGQESGSYALRGEKDRRKASARGRRGDFFVYPEQEAGSGSNGAVSPRGDSLASASYHPQHLSPRLSMADSGEQQQATGGFQKGETRNHKRHNGVGAGSGCHMASQRAAASHQFSATSGGDHVPRGLVDYSQTLDPNMERRGVANPHARAAARHSPDALVIAALETRGDLGVGDHRLRSSSLPTAASSSSATTSAPGTTHGSRASAATGAASGLNYFSPPVQARSTTDLRRSRRSRSGEYSRILSVAPPSPLTARAPANGSKAWGCDQHGNCDPGAPLFPSFFTIEHMETLLSLSGIKFITAELHTATIERTKKSGSESEDANDVGDTAWSSDDLPPSSPPPTQSEKGSREPRERKRLQKEEEVFRLFLHFGSYSVPSLSAPAGAAPQSPAMDGRPRANTTGHANAAAPAVFDDQRECRFFNKRERAEKFFAHLVQELTKANYKKVFIPPSPLMGSYEAQLQLSRGGELFKLAEHCALPHTSLSPHQQAKVAKEILHILKNSPPTSPISKTIQSKSVVRYLLKNAFYNLFPSYPSPPSSSSSSSANTSPSSSASSSSSSSMSTSPSSSPNTSSDEVRTRQPATAAVPPPSPSLSTLRRVGRIVNGSSPSFSPSVQSWRARGDPSSSSSSSSSANSSSPLSTSPSPLSSSPSSPSSMSAGAENEAKGRNDSERKSEARERKEKEQREQQRNHHQQQQQPQPQPREKRERPLIERWRKTIFRIMDIIREKHEDGYYIDEQDFNNSHFIKELTQSDLSHCYLYCLLKPFISSQYSSPTGAFGFERLSSVEFVQQLVRLNNPLLDQFVTFNFYTTANASGAKSAPSNLLYFCMDSLFRFPRNNILHNLVHDTVAAIFGRDEKRKRDRKVSGPSSRTTSGSGSYTIYGSSGTHRIRVGGSGSVGGFQGKLNRKLGKYKRVAESHGQHDDDSNEMDIEVAAQLCPEEEIEDMQELKARRELMARKWAKESMKLRRVALIECGLIEKLVAYFHALRAEKEARRKQRAAAAAAEEAARNNGAVDNDGDITLNSAERDLIKVEDDDDQSTNEEGNDVETSVVATNASSGKDASNAAAASPASPSSEPVQRILAGATWAGEENMGPVVKIINRMLRGRNNQYLTCSTHLLTCVLGVDEALARAWFEVVHTDLREINALDNSRPFEKPHVSFSSPLKNSFDNYHLNLLKFHRR